MIKVVNFLFRASKNHGFQVVDKQDPAKRRKRKPRPSGIGNLFVIYRLVFGTKNATCRFRPTCSAYAQEAFEKHGLLKGGILTFGRFLSCHPFSKRPLFDPVPEFKRKSYESV